MTRGVLGDRREDAKERGLHDDVDRDQSDAATGQGMPGATRRWERQRRICPEGLQRQHDTTAQGTLANTSILDF